MPNWKKLIVSGSDAVLNSVTATNGATITGSFRVTGSSNLIGNQTITGSILVTQSYISKVDYIDYTVNPGTLAHTEGRTYWDADRKTLQIDTDVNNFAISAGHVSVLRGRNTNSYTLTKGTVVYINGNSGQFATFTTASWENDPNSAYTIGLIAQDINANQFGYAVTDGEITGVNTNGFAPATLLYLSSSGQYTSTKPVAPRHTVRLGQVVVASVSGILQVKIDNGYELGELHDVLDSTTTSSYGDLLVKSGSLWINSKQLTGSYELTGSLIVSGTYGLNTSNATLFDGAEVASVIWWKRDLRDASDNSSVDWANRALYDSSTNQSVDWENKVLNDGANVASVNWNDRVLVDPGGTVISIDWSNRYLYDQYGNAALVYSDTGSSDQVRLYGTASLALTASYVENLPKAGSGSAASFGGTPRTASIAFFQKFPNNNYAVTITGEDARNWSIQSKTQFGFTINSNSSVALTGPVYWIAAPFAS